APAATQIYTLSLHDALPIYIPVIAITGSNGKTTTKELVTTALSTTFSVHATRGNLNNHIGVPLTLLSVPDGTELIICEMGANHRSEEHTSELQSRENLVCRL